MSGFGSDGKRITFFSREGNYTVRAFDQEDAERFANAPLMCLLASVLMVIGHFGASGRVLNDDFLMGFGITSGIAAFLFGFGGLSAERPLIWKELVIILVANLVLGQVHEGGVASLWQWDTLGAVAALVLVFGWYIAYGVTRLAWEPLIVAILFMIGIGVIATSTALGVLIYFTVLAGISFSCILVIYGSYWARESGFNRLPD